MPGGIFQLANPSRMTWYYALLVLSLLFSFIAGTGAADCKYDEKRQAGDPSGDDIASALTKDEQLSSICSGTFPPGNDRIATYNHWSMIYNITRNDPGQNILGCKEGFQNIIDQCISGGNYWGGIWTLNGFTYSIYNKAYPANGLGPNDRGGPSSNGGVNTVGTTSTRNGNTISTTNGNDGTTATRTTAAPSIPGETIVTEANSDGAPIVATVSQDLPLFSHEILTDC